MIRRMREFRRTLRVTTFAAALFASLPWPAAADARAEPGRCATLSACRLEHGILAFVGHRAAGEPSSLLGGAGAAGCGAGDPSLEISASRAPGGRWSDVQVGTAASGIPFEHRYHLWTLAGSDPGGEPSDSYRMLPLSTEHGLNRHLIDVAADVEERAVSALDRWTFVIAEQGHDGGMLLRRVSSEGEDVDELVVDVAASWYPTWPAGTRLLSVDGTPDVVAVFGREPSTGRVHVELVRGSESQPLPSRDVPTADLVAGAWLAGSAALFVLHDGSLTVLHPAMDAWVDMVASAAPPLPRAADCPPESMALAAVASGRSREDADALLLCGDVLHSRTLVGGAWSDGGALSLASASSPSRQRSLEPSPREDVAEPGGRPWLVPAVIAGACLLGLGVLLWRWWIGP
jgi:hypothetical protein